MRSCKRTGGNMADPGERLKVLINSMTPIVVIESVEEVRAVDLVRSTCAELNLPVFQWSIADGLSRCGSNTAAHEQPVVIGNTREPQQALAHLETMNIEAVFLLKDFHRHLDDPVVVRRLRDVAQDFCSHRRSLIITAPAITFPPELEGLVEYLPLPLPDVKRLRQMVEEIFSRLAKTRALKRKLDAAGVDAIAENLRGLTEEEADRAVTQAIIAQYALSPEVITSVLEMKKSLLRRSGMLEFVEASESMASVGGLDNLKQWLQQRYGAWDESARSFGLEAPRGVIILGVQGCGKSMCARAIAGEWKLPLVKFDSSAVFDKYIGETEKRVKKMFQVAEELAPAVLWIDELEKVFAGSSADSASSDAGVSSRLLAAFLSWMQDRTAPVFVAATSNNVNVLPPELIRKGRFDELFFVDLPNGAERRAILSIQLTRHKQNPENFDLSPVAAAAHGYSGAEIDAAVQTAMYAAYSSKKLLTTEALLKALQTTVPLSLTRAEHIQALRAWARQRAVPASTPDPQTENA
jgi:ATP-dependent 26S proteasome regulatory subunit